jgi:hypothetical protein
MSSVYFISGAAIAFALVAVVMNIRTVILVRRIRSTR